MALKKIPPREKRLILAKQWLETYEGKNIAKGYRKHFGVPPLCAVKDLQMLGFEFTDDYIEALKISQKNCRKQKDVDKLKRKFKNHEYVEGKLLQTNKKFSQLKMKQKEFISALIKDEFRRYYELNKEFPVKKSDKEEVIQNIYDKINEREIWIPFGEFKKFFISKQTRIKNKILKESVDIE